MWMTPNLFCNVRYVMLRTKLIIHLINGTAKLCMSRQFVVASPISLENRDEVIIFIAWYVLSQAIYFFNERLQSRYLTLR